MVERSKPQRCDEGNVVVDPAPNSVPGLLEDRLPQHLGEVLPGEDLLVRGSQVELVEYRRRVGGHHLAEPGAFTLQLVGQPALPFERPTELLHVSRIHAGEPRLAQCVIRRYANSADRPRHPVIQQGGYGEGVRSSPGSTHDREAPHPEGVGDGGDVCHAVRHGSARGWRSDPP